MCRAHAKPLLLLMLVLVGLPRVRCRPIAVEVPTEMIPITPERSPQGPVTGPPPAPFSFAVTVPLPALEAAFTAHRVGLKPP